MYLLIVNFAVVRHDFHVEMNRKCQRKQQTIMIKTYHRPQGVELYPSQKCTTVVAEFLTIDIIRIQTKSG